MTENTQINIQIDSANKEFVDEMFTSMLESLDKSNFI